PYARRESISILVWKPSVMPLDLVKRHILTMGSSQDFNVAASALAGLCSNCVPSSDAAPCTVRRRRAGRTDRLQGRGAPPWGGWGLQRIVLVFADDQRAVGAGGGQFGQDLGACPGGAFGADQGVVRLFTELDLALGLGQAQGIDHFRAAQGAGRAFDRVVP